MFKEIYIPIDNSEFSNRALETGLRLAKFYGATLVGSHVYAAKLHDQRFRAMESGLPEEFQKEKALEKQRDIHDSLITNGLELITDSYLSVMAERCKEGGVPFQGLSLEGKNWHSLVDDISSNGYDLVVMGAFGLGRTPESLVGTVCDRVVRRIESDVLVVRKMEEPPDDAPIVVCLDGSDRSWGGLELGFSLAEKTGRPLAAVSAFDPYFHYGVFEGLKTALSDRAKEVFKFEQQELLHEQIIDSGLAKIYQSYLDIASKMAEGDGKSIQTKLLDGKASQKVLEYAKLNRPWLMIMGRTGIHSGEELDLGGVTENMLRQAPCDLLITNRKMRPPLEYEAEVSTKWTEEASEMLARAPEMVRGVASAAIQRFALAEGYTMITSQVVEQALEQILPPQARAAMGITGGGGSSGQEQAGSFSLNFICPSCGYVHHLKRPKICPVCQMEGNRFRVGPEEKAPEKGELDGDKKKGGEKGEGNLVSKETFDGITLWWSKEAQDLIKTAGDDFAQDKARQKIEKKARTRKLKTITEEFVRENLTIPAHEEIAPLPDIKPGWDQAGWARLLKAPEGFMRDKARASIEEYAREIGAEMITLDVAEKGMAKAREKMME